MTRSLVRWTSIAIAAFVFLFPGPRGAAAQDVADPDTTATGPLSAAEIDQLTAPIALYSDPLLGAVLAAATYPLEIVEAARWLGAPDNAALSGDSLAAALQRKDWDASVKSLVQFPDVLRMMNDDLQWTERLGDAFLAQQSDVMNSVQRLRQRAAAAGALQSTPQQSVASQDDNVTIEPTSPDVIYASFYDPVQVYGTWPWPDNPPVYFAQPTGVYFVSGLIGFGSAVPIAAPLWGGYAWNWPHHGLMVKPHGSGRGPLRPWGHDPGHRGGVPYSSTALAQRYLGPGAVARKDFRGYPPAQAVRAAAQPSAAPARAEPGVRPVPHPPPAPPAPPPASAHTPPVRPEAPAFESFGHGAQVRGEANRGSESRAAPATPPTTSPAPAAVPASHPR